MAGTLNVNQLIPDQGQDLYINTGQYGANLVVGNATTQILVVTPDGGLKVPVGTTAGRPANPVIGYIRFNTDTNALENYTANGWLKVTATIPVLASVSGTIYSGNTSTLTLSGSGFQLTAANVNFASGTTTANVSTIPTNGGTVATVLVPSAIYNLNAGNTVSITISNGDQYTSNPQSTTIIGLPTGGNTITSIGTTRIHTFNSSGTLTVPTSFSATASYLVVAGGGGGGQDIGGGGGAGGVVSGTTSISAGSYSVVVGSGGLKDSESAHATQGGTSSFGPSISSVGGGGGASPNNPSNGYPGGSGGGGFCQSNGGSGTPGQGNPGGAGNGPISSPSSLGGGGGGASQSGNANGLAYGGDGLSSTITGSPVYYAGGGSGTNIPNNSPATGGLGGGGTASGTRNGTVNTGGGASAGYGSWGSAGNGGSGIVIVSYTI